MIQGFKEFISKGNVLDLAVAVIIGASFTPIVKSVTDVIMSIIGAIVGQPNFDSVLQFSIRGSDPIQPGTIITAIVNFLLVASALYFAIVVPMNALNKRRAKEDAEKVEEPSEDVKLLSEIRDLLAEKN